MKTIRRTSFNSMTRSVWISGEMRRIRFNLQHVGVFVLVTAILSNLVSNVPAVMLLKSLMTRFADPHSAWLTLAKTSTLAGNLTESVCLSRF